MSRNPKKRDIAEFFQSRTPAVESKPNSVRVKSTIQTTATPSGAPDKACITIHPSSRHGQHVNNPARSTAAPQDDETIIVQLPGQHATDPTRQVSCLHATSSRVVPKELNSSFGALSSSHPDSSSTSTTQKIYKDNKLVAVKDSDDDEDDNSSMESLGDLFTRTKQDSLPMSSGRLQPRVHAQTDEQEEERRRLLDMYTGGARHLPLFKRDELKAYLVKDQRPAFDFSILTDVDGHVEDARVAKADMNLAQSLKELEAVKQTAIDKKLLASILEHDLLQNVEDDDRLARIMNAVDRTEALAGEHTFSFFGQYGIRAATNQDRNELSFPLTSSSLQLQDRASRDEHYLSGFMVEQAELGDLDDECIRWTYQAYMHESRVDLRHAYLDVVSAGSSRWTRSGLTAQDVQSSFEMLGACSEVLRDGERVQRRQTLQRDHPNHDYSELTNVLRMYHALCEDMDFSTLSKLSSLVVRLSLDEEVMSNVDVCSTVAGLLEALADLRNTESRRHVHERIETELLVCITDAILQARFFHHFVPTLQHGVELRIALARKIVLGYCTSDDAPNQQNEISRNGSGKVEDLHPLILLTDHIATSRAWQTHSSHEPDYIALKALSFVLDVAITDGRPDLLLLHDSSSTRSVPAQHEKLFNELVDDLSDLISDRASQIRDNGASHLSRSELKDAMQSLHRRLIYTVRTRKKTRRHVFDADRQMDLTALLESRDGPEKRRVRIIDDKNKIEEQEEDDKVHAEVGNETPREEKRPGSGFLARYKARKSLAFKQNASSEEALKAKS